jgi:hypothetical protein
MSEFWNQPIAATDALIGVALILFVLALFLVAVWRR